MTHWLGSREKHQPTIASIDVPTARRVAEASCPVLLSGRTGVGKGYLARWLHDHGPRAAKPFVPVNCGAIPEGVIDSHLFGHRRGAFSDAHCDQPGLVGTAEGGTLFLDEVAELTPAAQCRLLRLLEEREVQPVGCARPRRVDVRVLAASACDLRELVAAGGFREDLFYRLDVIHLVVKPLRARRREIPGLITTLTQDVASVMDRTPLAYEPSALTRLVDADWPGNVRQLRTVIERLHIFLGEDDVVNVATIEQYGQMEPRRVVPTIVTRNGGGGGARATRREAARHALTACGGCVSRAARELGVHRSTVHRWLGA